MLEPKRDFLALGLPTEIDQVAPVRSRAPYALAILAVMVMLMVTGWVPIALAASAAFTTPVSSPVNTLVLVPGKYHFGDFVRIGVPFTIIVLLLVVLLVPWLLPLHP